MSDGSDTRGDPIHSMNQISDSRYHHQEVMVAGVRATLPVFATVVVFSFFINLLLFVSPLYMLQIYDRVISSRSETTLLSLTVLAAILIGVYAALETLRSRLLVRAGLVIRRENRRSRLQRGASRKPPSTRRKPRASPTRRRHRPRILDRRRTDSPLRCALVSSVCFRRLSAASLVRLHCPRGQRHYIEPDAPERNRNEEVAERRESGGDGGQSNGSIDVPQYGSAPGDGHAPRHQNELDSTARKHANASGFGQRSGWHHCGGNQILPNFHANSRSWALAPIS